MQYVTRIKDSQMQTNSFWHDSLIRAEYDAIGLFTKVSGDNVQTDK